MADYSLQEFWWNKPSRTESQLPALQLGVQIVQRKAQQDLQERDLANDIARTSIMRDEQLAKQKIQTMLVAGNAEIATAISEVTDWNDDEQVAKVWATGARNPMTVGGKAWLGAQHMRESARKAKILQENTQSLIARREAQTELATIDQERKALLADASVDLTDRRIVDLDDRRDLNLQKQALAEKKYELDSMLGASEMEYDDARIQKLRQEINFGERQMLIKEGNLKLRAQELGQKGRRLDAREQAGYNNELKALNNEENAKLKAVKLDEPESDRLRKLYNLKRREIRDKFYGPASTNAPAVAPGAPVAPAGDGRDHMPAFPAMPSRKEDLKVDEVYITPRGPALWDGEKFIPQ